jgi:NAD-dependent deacetylase
MRLSMLQCSTAILTAGYPALARKGGAFCIEINPEPSGAIRYDLVISEPASVALQKLFGRK